MEMGKDYEFLMRPENECNCTECPWACPENWERMDIYPCGQQKCWVPCYCSDEQ